MPADLTPDMPADRAAVVVAERLLAAIEANLPGALAGDDPEDLHDMRVAVRRTRSLLRELGPVFPPDARARFRADLRWLQRVTGPTRDLDVYVLEFGDDAGLRQLFEERARRERGIMEDALRSSQTRAILDDWRDLLGQLPQLPVDDRPDAVRPVGEVAAHRIGRVYRQMVKMGKAIDDGSPHAALHDLRKKGKELRYLLEFFAPLFPKKATKPMVATLKSLQDSLGRFQDREVQAAMLRELEPEVARRDGGDVDARAMDSLVARLEADQQAARAEFADRFAAFASKDQRKVVKKTFRAADRS